MCTSIRLLGEEMYFGRNMDIEDGFDWKVVLLPRRYRIKYRHGGEDNYHYAIFGMAAVINGYPLFADCMNEAGVGIAGLALTESCRYFSECEKYGGKHKIASFEVPLLLFSRCKSVAECVELMKNTVIVDTNFSSEVSATPLHWHIADRKSSAVIEQTKDGMNIYQSRADVLTNEPTFDVHLRGLSMYGNLTSKRAENCLTRLCGDGQGFGEGSVGLPGDYTSRSRFVKSAYLVGLSREIKVKKLDEGHLFSLLSAVAVPFGAVNEGKMHYTVYTSLMNSEKMSYTYIGKDRLNVKRYYMKDYDLEGDELIVVKERS